MDNKKCFIYIFIVLFLVKINHSECAMSSICNSLTIINEFHSCDVKNQTLFTFNFTVEVEIDSTNQTFPNRLTFSNFSFTTIDNSSYYLTAPIELISPYYRYICPTLDYPCIINTFDGDQIEIDIYYYTIGIYYPWTTSQNISNSAIDHLYIDKGNLYSLGDNDGFIFNPFDRRSPLCFNGGLYVCYYEIKATYFCCNNFLYFDVPDNKNDSCQQFETNLKIKDHDESIIFELHASHYFGPDYGWKLAFITNVTYYRSIYSNVTYYFGPQALYYCTGNVSSPTSGCSVYMDNNLYPFYNNSLHDIAFHTWGESKYYALTGKVIQLNGTYYKTFNEPFTKNDPCWNNTMNVPFQTGKRAESTFCCTQFSSDTFSTTSTYTPQTVATTTTTDYWKICQKYHSRTTVNDSSSTYLEVEYLLNQTNLYVQIINYFGADNSRVQLEAYSSDLFSQACSATSSNPVNNCVFNISANHQYELQMRTSIMPDGFNMVKLVEENNQFTSPSLTPSSPCHVEVNPYNYGNSKLAANTEFCCSLFS